MTNVILQGWALHYVVSLCAEWCDSKFVTVHVEWRHKSGKNEFEICVCS